MYAVKRIVFVLLSVLWTGGVVARCLQSPSALATFLDMLPAQVDQSIFKNFDQIPGETPEEKLLATLVNDFGMKKLGRSFQAACDELLTLRWFLSAAKLHMFDGAAWYECDMKKGGVVKDHAGRLSLRCQEMVNGAAASGLFLDINPRAFKELCINDSIQKLVWFHDDGGRAALLKRIVPLQFDYFGYYEIQGSRPTQEDAVAIARNAQYELYMVFDGHGGDSVSVALGEQFGALFLDFLSDREPDDIVIKTFFQDLDQRLFAGSYGVGSTASGLLYDRARDVLFLINLGDSRTVLCNALAAIRETVDHKPLLEKKRIVAAGGDVHALFGTPRIVLPDSMWHGGLAVSRAFGDADYKQKGLIVSNEPEIVRVPAKDVCNAIIGCDGLWDGEGMSSAVAASLANELKNAGKSNNEIARELCKRGTINDNVTVLFIDVAAMRARRMAVK